VAEFLVEGLLSGTIDLRHTEEDSNKIPATLARTTLGQNDDQAGPIKTSVSR
jgi:hypothetical protein